MSVVAVVGLGYVGLPLAVEFGKQLPHDRLRPVGRRRSTAIGASSIRPASVRRENLKAATLLEVTTDAAKLADADFVVVAVPTPVDAGAPARLHRRSSARARRSARNLKKGAIVVYESTVYPGATEEVCVPILEAKSGLKWMRDFHVGYSPERINPGDKERTLTKITKVVSGDDADTLKQVAELYGASSRPASIRRRASRSPRPRRSSRTRSATSTSR